MITDPRNYTLEYPKTNILLNQIKMYEEGFLTKDEIITHLQNMLKNANNLQINLALNLSDSYSMAHTLWQLIDQAINFPKLRLFAIPVVIVAGANDSTILHTAIDSLILKQFFQQYQITNIEKVTDSLIDGATLAQIPFSQIYDWQNNFVLQSLFTTVANTTDTNTIRLSNEGVFLRFLLAVSADGIINFINYQNHTMDLMKLLLTQLKYDQSTIFPILGNIESLNQAYVAGSNLHKEISISVELSNQLRKIRHAGLIPSLDLFSEENSIMIALSTDKLSNFNKLWQWELKPYDNFVEIMRKLIELMGDLAVEIKINGINDEKYSIR